MGKLHKINVQTDVLVNLVRGMMETIPGIDNALGYEISFNQEHQPVLTIKYHPSDEVVNIYDLSLKIQDIVYFKIYNDFDLKSLVVNVIAL